jgi:hypothetical protein
MAPGAGTSRGSGIRNLRLDIAGGPGIRSARCAVGRRELAADPIRAEGGPSRVLCGVPIAIEEIAGV